MSAKIGFPCALMLAVLGCSAAHAQGMYPTVNHTGADLHNTAAHAPLGTPQPPPPKGPPQLDDWITYTPRDCCGAGGCNGPIGFEVYLRNGASIPIGGGTISDFIETGWMLQGGGRVLFFNPERDMAWTIDLGITNIANRANASADNAIGMTVLVPRPTDPNNPANVNPAGLPAPFLSAPLGNYPADAAIPVVFGGDNFGTNIPGLTMTSVNRTFAHIGLGREWYITSSAYRCNGPMWRAGLDVGGRWGTAKANFQEIRHRTDVVTGVYTALHSDLEIPCGGCCKFQLGVRVEWDWTWMDILQTNNADISELNLIATTGIRF